MNFIWNAFEVFVNVFQGFFFTYTTYKYLGAKQDKTFTNSCGIYFGFILSLLITIETYLLPIEHFFFILYVIVLFFYAFIFLKGSIIEKMFFSAIPVSLICLCAVLGIYVSMLLFKGHFEMIISMPCWERFFMIVFSQLLAIYLSEIIVRLRRINNKPNNLLIYEWSFIILVLVVSLIVGAYILALNEENVVHIELYSVIILVSIISINIIACYLVVDFGKKNQAINENKLLKISQEHTRQYVDNVNREYETLKKLRHDCKNNYLVIYSLLEKGKYQSAIEQLRKNIDIISDTEIFINTNNMVVNAIVNAKLSTAKTLGIECTCFSVSDITGIDDIDICRMLSNMLDNAITACQHNRIDKNFISLQITSNNICYTFSLKNTISSSVLKDNPSLLSTKPEQGMHGYGTKIIREISNRYNGYLDIYEENGSFCCNVIMKPNI